MCLDIMRRKDLHGLTLAELLTSMGLLSIILSICASLFVSSLTRFQIANAVQTIEMNATLGIDRLARDLRETTRDAIINHACANYSDRYIYFPSPRNLNGQIQKTVKGLGTQWNTWIVYYIFPDETNKQKQTFILARKQIERGFMFPPNNSDMSNIQNASIAARNIYSFEIRRSELDIYSIDIFIETIKFVKGKACTFKAEKTVYLNNLRDF